MLSLFTNYLFYPVLFIVGVWLCWKYRFRGGAIFFLLLLLNQLFTILYPFYSRIILESLPDRIKFAHSVQSMHFIETIKIILTVSAFLILLLSLHKLLTSRDLFSIMLNRVKSAILSHKKRAAIVAFIVVIVCSVLLFNAFSKDFQLIEAKVEITNDPSTPTGLTFKEGEETVQQPEYYLVYTFTIRNKGEAFYRENITRVHVDFVPSKKLLHSFGEEVYQNSGGMRGSEQIKENSTREFTVTYNIFDGDVNLVELEAQALDGLVYVSVHPNNYTILKIK